MKVFSRTRTKIDELDDRFTNSFQKTGFVNTDLLESEDRDFWEAYKDMLTDTNISSVFDSILVGYKEVPYSEAVVQRALLGIYKDEELYKQTGEVYSSINVTKFRIFKCLFIYSPVNFTNPVRGSEIKNTIDMIDGLYRKEYTIVPHVYKFLKDQLKLHSYDINNLGNKKENLFNKDIVTLLVPILFRNSYYELNGVKRYPNISECFHNNKSHLGQIKMIFVARNSPKKPAKKKDDKKKNDKAVATKGRTKKVYGKRTAYFDSGIYQDHTTGNAVEIFYCKFFTKAYNLFFAFDKDEIDGLMRDLMSYDLTEKTKRILQNTYDIYCRDVELVREKCKGSIPAINIYKPDDSYYDNQDSSEMENILGNIDGGDDSDDDEDVSEGASFDVDIDSQSEEDLKAEEEEEIKRKEQEIVQDQKLSKTFTVSRYTISLSKLKSLILGYNGKLYLGFYSHLGDNLLKITDLNSSGFSKDGTSSKQAPKTLQIIKTISSNPDAFVSNTNTNPIDVFHKLSYRKYLHERDTTPNNPKAKGSRSGVPFKERFLYLKENFGIIDPTTTKSETSSGIAGNVSMMNYYRDQFELNKFKK